MRNLSVRTATSKDSKIIKDMVNEMYGIEYEKRDLQVIEAAILSNRELYILAYIDSFCVGFAGATLKDNNAILDYIYVKDDYRGLAVAYEMLMKIVEEIIDAGINSAILQVQTFNKQKFFHYAISDKNIIETKKCERKNEEYEDQILKIQDLRKLKDITFKELMNKVLKYKNE